MANVLGRGLDPLPAYKALDELWGKVIAITEGGLRGSNEEIEVPEEVRDCLMFGNVRKFFASLPNAPQT